MAVNDPIGDMITRIRNAQMRSKSNLDAGLQAARTRARGAFKTEGFIRGYASALRMPAADPNSRSN